MTSRQETAAASTNAQPERKPTWRGHLRIARVDHWVKNVFVLPGIVVALSVAPARLNWSLALQLLLGLAAVSLVTSSNYVIDELLHAPYDRLHHEMPAAGAVRSRPGAAAYVQWLALGAAGMALASLVSRGLLVAMIALWLMGCTTTFRRCAPRTCRTSTCSPRRSTIRCGCWPAGTWSR